MKTFLSLSAALGAAIAAHAQIPPSAGDPTPDGPGRGDVVVTASGVVQDADTVGQAVTVLDRDLIERRQTVVLSDLLATTPGVTVSRNGGIGGLTSVRIRGAEAEQTLVVIDGVRVNDPSSPGGGFDFANLLAASVDRVEVLRGPDSVPWGSAAIGGVVNIVTQRPTDALQLRAQAEGGSDGTAFASAGVSGGTGALTGALTTGYLRTDGVSAYARGTEPDGYRQIGATGRLGYAFTPGIGIDLAGYYAHSRVALDGYAPPTYAFGDDAEYSTAQEAYGDAGLHANMADGRARNRVAFTIADINRDNYAAAGADPLYRYRGRTERYSYAGDFRPIDTVRVVLGAERENQRYFDGSLRARTGITSAYGELILQPVRALTLTGGVRHDDHDQFGSHTSFAADAALALATGTTLRASYGEAFKAPTLFELFSDYGTRSLRPEVARSYDLGVAQALPGGAARLSATYFHRRTRDQIDFQSCPTTQVTDPTTICYRRPDGTYANLDRTTAQGVELALSLRPVTGFTVEANYSFIDSRNRSAGAEGLQLARRPRDTANVSTDHRFPFGLSLGGTVQLVGDSFDDAANTVRLDGYALFGLRAELPITRRLTLYGRVDNVTDERYQVVADYGTLGRAAYGGVKLRLN
ncbi:TonB-dependent receptor plug domain-containing protein [uncultured Sphingomonas sp.]|uniref:TonB-dependent receptor plug domain-containing protein n=1 Tax=uncultured Sphingomonas sp. TaxID=158754 RepID=UPI0035CC5FB4